MTVKASTSITIAKDRDTQSVTRFYKIAPSTSTPTQPTGIGDPSGWQKVEPAYDGTSTNSLYFTDRTIFTDGTVSWSPVSKSSSYEASKQAYNKAEAAEGSANDAATKATNYITTVTGTRGISVHDQGDEKNFVNMNSTDGVTIYRDINGTATNVANFGESVRVGTESANHLQIDNDSIDFMDGNTQIGYVGADSARFPIIHASSRISVGNKYEWRITPSGSLGLYVR